MQIRKLILKLKSGNTVEIDLTQEKVDFQEVFNQILLCDISIKPVKDTSRLKNITKLSALAFNYLVDNIIRLNIKQDSLALTLKHGYRQYYKHHVFFEIGTETQPELISFPDFFDLADMTYDFEKSNYYGNRFYATLLDNKQSEVYIEKIYDMDNCISSVSICLVNEG